MLPFNIIDIQLSQQCYLQKLFVLNTMSIIYYSVLISKSKLISLAFGVVVGINTLAMKHFDTYSCIVQYNKYNSPGLICVSYVRSTGKASTTSVSPIVPPPPPN